MKIEKFNESRIWKGFSDKDLNDAIEIIVEKFFGDDTGNMGTYSSVLDQDKIKFIFEFDVIQDDELEILNNLTDYIRRFDNNCERLFYPINLTSDGESMVMIFCQIKINLNDYKKIPKDLERYKTEKKYNV